LHLGGGRYAQVVAKNATLPTRESRVVPTTVDGQRELTIDVFEGESADVRYNRPVGAFTVTGLPDAPAGEVLVMIDFTVDVNGLLSVSARELGSGAPAEVRLKATSGLTRREVRKLAEIRRQL
jgi:molecular chaperone DnaK